MSTENLIQAIFVGVCLYAAILHLIVGLRSEPRDRAHIIFAVVSLLFAVFSMNLFFLYLAFDSRDLARYLFTDKWGIATNTIGYAALFWFITLYTSTKWGFSLWSITGLYALIALSNFILPYTWVYTDIELTNSFPPNITIAPWYYIEIATTELILVGYSTYCILGQYRRGERGAAQALAIAVGIFLATLIYDNLIEFGLIDSVLMQQYGFMAFIVIMSLRLTSEAVKERTEELSLANRALIKARDAAEAANRAKSVFLANMSHELRTPLNAILGHAQIMSRNLSLQPDQRVAVKAITKSGDHLLTLINSVLEMSKVEAGQVVLTPSSFMIDSVIADMKIMFDDRMKQKGLGFSVEKDAKVTDAIEADRGKINQILINLISNAVRHTTSGAITLRVEVAGVSGDASQLTFEVEDHGPGIAADKLQKIFEPFVQIDAKGKQQTGTGLGLAISRQFAELMGGNLTLESREGEGSVFRLMIPVVEAGSPLREAEDAAARRILGIAGEQRDFRVLVVDDDPSNREVFLGMFSPLDFDVQEAADGREAIDMFVDWSPHLILMDIRMPGIDGIEAIQTIKSTEKGRTTPIIGVSASVFEEDRNKVIEIGADYFIAKPIRESELWEKVGQCLNVEFIFAEERQADAESLEANPLTKENISELPNELVKEMREAIQGGYMDRGAELAGRAADHHPELSQMLLRLVDQYDFESLSRLFAEDRDDKAPTR